MNASILQTKLHIPPVQPELVSRPRLIKRLHEGLRAHRALTLVSAPAGYGKTTLVADWLHQLQQDAAADRAAHRAWLSLDEEDNAPLRFFTHLLASIQAAGPALPDAEQALLSISHPVDDAATRSLLTALLNDLSHADDDRPLVIVLDDYHRIQTAVIHRAMQFWLEHAPPHVHLVLVTREDPPLTLARWRVGNQMTELRVGDLRFAPEEAVAFLQQTMRLSLTPEDVAVLDVRTEGWVAGLQLAAVALRASAHGEPTVDAAAFIAAFSGSHYYVIDYLLEEVLRQQDAAVRDFLRQTAILARLNAPLCNAVTGRTDSRAILTHLERNNLFLIPLDNQRHWYRYHHLIADSLQTLLDDDQQAVLHQRAARWYEENGFPAEAVRHALATGDRALAADVMERVIQQAAAWSRGDVARLTGWLAALPDAVLRARPALSLHASRALYLAGDLTGAERLVQQANVALRTAADTDDTAADHGLYALATVYRAAISALRGENLTEAVAAVADLPDALAVSHTHTAARAADTLALAHELLGHLAAAERAYLQASDLAQAAGVRYLAINARCEAALVQIQRGRLTEADHTCRAALELAGDDAIPPTGLAWTVLGEIARERNELETAARHLATGIELAQQGGITDDLRHAFLFLARLKQAQGDPPAALEAWRQADRILHRYNVPRLASLSAAARARLDLAQGNLAAARRWAAAYRGQSCEPSFEAVQDVEALTLIRVLLATGEPDAALDRVQPLLAAARQSGRLRTVMEGLLLRAQILWTQQSTGAATASLREAVSLAAPEEFARLFLDGGPVVAELLPDVREAAPDFVDGLLAALGLQADEVANVDEAVAPPADSIEPLSEREEEVLRLLVAGRSNREIAEALVITVGTAKWHVHNIYQKLGVGSRAEAIARVHAWSERSP